MYITKYYMAIENTSFLLEDCFICDPTAVLTVPGILWAACAMWRACTRPPGTDLVSNPSTGSPDLHFPPFEDPGRGEGRAETLNHFVLICFMILLGAVFTQIRQASGLDNLLEISGI